MANGDEIRNNNLLLGIITYSYHIGITFPSQFKDAKKPATISWQFLRIAWSFIPPFKKDSTDKML